MFRAPALEGRIRAALGAWTFAALVVLGGCSEREAEFAAPPPPTVTVAHPQEREVAATRRLIGRLEASDVVEVRARVQGFLRERRFEPGDVVEAGQVLFLVEPEGYQARVGSAEAALERAKVAAELARIKLERTKRAADSGAATDLELLQTTAEHEDAKAGILEAEAALESAKLDLEYTTVLAPISGRAAEHEVDVGNLVGAGSPTLLTTIVEDREVRVYFEVNERELLAYLEQSESPRDNSRRGSTPVTLYLADGSKYEHQGSVDYVAPQLDRTTGTITVRATVPNPDGKLFAGMVVRVELASDPEPALLVPQVAVMRDMGGAFVFTVDSSNIVARTPVEVGSAFSEEVVVTRGLSAEDRVIINGTQRAREGIEVAPAAADASAEQGARG